MPAFANYSNKPVTIAEGPTSRVVQIKEEVESLFPLDDLYSLTRLSDSPYFNPIVKLDKVLAGASNFEIKINIKQVSKVKIICNESQDVFINDPSNNPPLHIVNGEIIFITPCKLITKLFFNGGCTVIQLRDQVVINN